MYFSLYTSQFRKFCIIVHRFLKGNNLHVYDHRVDGIVASVSTNKSTFVPSLITTIREKLFEASNYLYSFEFLSKLFHLFLQMQFNPRESIDSKLHIARREYISRKTFSIIPV